MMAFSGRNPRTPYLAERSMDDTETGGMTWPRWRLVLLLMAVCFLAHFNRVCMPVAGDTRIMEQYDLSPTSMGWVYSAFLIAYTLLMIPGGWLIDRWGPRFALTVVCLGSALFVALTGAAGLFSSAIVVFPLLIVVRAAMGTVSAPLHPAAARAVSLGIPVAHRSTANGLVTGAALLGVAGTYVLFGGLIDQLNWPGAFVVAAGVTALVGLLWLRFGTEADPAHARMNAVQVQAVELHTTQSISPVDVVSFLARHQSLTLLTLSYAAVGYFQYLFFYWIHYYFSDVLKLGEEQSRFYATLPPLAMAVCMPLGGWISDRLEAAAGPRIGRGGLAMVAMLGSAGLLWLGARAADPQLSVTLFSLALGSLGLAEGPFWVTAVEVGGRRGGLSASIFNTGGNAGGILAPVITPFISDDLGFGWQSGLSVGALVSLLGAACWLGIHFGKRV